MQLSSFQPLVIEQVSPVVDGGRYPIKRLAGEKVEVGAAIYKDGHDMITARIIVRDGGGEEVAAVPLEYEYNPDHWQGAFSLDAPGLYEMTVEAWPDSFKTWRRDLEKRIEAGQDVALEFRVGAEFVAKRRLLASAEQKEPLENAAKVLEDESAGFEMRKRVAFSQTLLDLMNGPLSEDDVVVAGPYRVRVDRREAGFSAWYELFPRSQGTDPNKHGTFADTERRIPEIAALGFDVIYVPPIHPIGETHRKGRNNTTVAEPGDVGSPWAIGSDLGGHTAVHPELGTLEDFRKLVRTAAEFGIEISIDFALQCSPDHPWVKQHPEWFFVLPDGSIRYAENPPKRYEDIYPLNFWGEGGEGLWEASRDALLFWVEQGVKIFRVDNPHTKPLSFWEWCIKEVQDKHPDTIFLSESFTRPNRMQGLAKLGFTQSYTYFTWKNSKEDLVEYLTELTTAPVCEYYRPNFFANTPDILHEYLQTGGRPAFLIRHLLASTLAPVYGIYSGYELCENQPVHKGSEEYLDSEKYEVRVRDWNAPGNIKRDIARLNRIRQSEPALCQLTNLQFIEAGSEHVVAYLKRDDPAKGEEPTGHAPRHLLGIVNLDPFSAHDAIIHVPVESLGIGADEEYVVRDLLTGTVYTWRGRENYVRLDPSDKVGHLFRIEPA